MTWTSNLLTLNDQQLRYPQCAGSGNCDVVSNVVKQFANDQQSLFTCQPTQEHRASLPTKLRLGSGGRISEYFEAGLDVTLPLNMAHKEGDCFGEPSRVRPRTLHAPKPL